MTSRWLMALLIAVGLVGFAPAPASAQTQTTYTLTATLTGAGESTTTTPAINTGAFGTATITINIVTRVITWIVKVWNLPSGVTAAHIHAGAEGTPGPTIVNFAVPTNASNDFDIAGLATEAGITIRAEQGIRSWDDVAQAIIGGNTYVNVHSAVNPGGEIRGQLKVVPAP